MSRIAKAPIELPSGVEIKIAANEVSVKGPKGNLVQKLHPKVSLEQEDNIVTVKPAGNSDIPMAGTMRSLVNNMVVGVSNGFEKKLTLVGVGYRAQVQGSKLTLALGYSHPIEYTAPDGVTIEAPSQTEIVVKGCDKQKVGQIASEIRAFRPPEPYKGKGVRYSDERVVRKEAKKA
ncbi:MAG: 50S ribosomal protein L6 [Xanthomonadales bacterium]|nr:50S ribosomal protein L6 [Gammaproteobacteria bacterium]MBT8052026.1 50S ribosomal protein L6 [Gammaproteobacteria bacterium]MBT8056787.1 50S ribosomal protein L6 [Gammaproteobacteria bacterium]NNJ78166.1 50S ribosomal protein L6 [Xanthomonadales bacterium]NNL04449.1 50S ribosomal protein L6 [Xanthomonadales bacterium]